MKTIIWAHLALQLYCIVYEALQRNMFLYTAHECQFYVLGLANTMNHIVLLFSFKHLNLGAKLPGTIQGSRE